MKIFYKLTIIYLILSFAYNIIISNKYTEIGSYNIERLVVESPNNKYKLHFIDKIETLSTRYLETKIFIEDIENEKMVNYITINTPTHVRPINQDVFYNNISIEFKEDYANIIVEILEPQYINSYHYEDLNTKFKVVDNINYVINIQEVLNSDINDTDLYFDIITDERYSYE